MNLTYKTIKNISKGIFKDRNSKFISIAIPVDKVDDIKEHLLKIKKEYHDARHHCYAWKVGVNNPQYRVNDDGEPSNSAGTPIYHRILSNELTNILIVVVRYFGGTKLGIPGLINAYKNAAQNAIDNNEIIEKQICETFFIELNYDKLNTIMKYINETNGNILNQEFTDKCKIKVDIPLNVIDLFEQKLTSLQEIIYKKTDK
ncbi:MAG: YigZ family protein [Marinilabiliales bacterium]